MSVFVDTSALYALLDADDEQHQAAKQVWFDLLDGGRKLVVTSYVLVETMALLQNRLGMPAVRDFSAGVLPVLTTVWVTEGMHRSAHHALLIADRGRVSLVDFVSFAVMQRLEITDAFCFDPHFADQGRRVLPAAGY